MVARHFASRLFIAGFLCIATLLLLFGVRGDAFVAREQSDSVRGQSREAAAQKSAGCMSCHSPMDEATMHPTKTVQLGCTDCHGGNAEASVAAGASANSSEYVAAKLKAHIQPRDAIFRNRGARAPDVFAKWLKEPAEYVKFVNPGDLRVAAILMGSGSLQQRSDYREEHALWGKLRPRRQTAADQNFPAANQRRIPHERCSAGTHAALSLGNFATGKRAARIRTGRGEKS